MDKCEKEMRTVYEMIHLYCRKKHKEKELCPECLELYEYAKMRIEKCPFMETKTFCLQCKVHCYKKDKREEIRKVMRFQDLECCFIILSWQFVISTIKLQINKKNMHINRKYLRKICKNDIMPIV